MPAQTEELYKLPQKAYNNQDEAKNHHQICSFYVSGG